MEQVTKEFNIVNKDYIETYLIEWNADNSYYGRICNDCKFHKEKIQQSIEAGADAEWWKHMCTDFCKQQWNKMVYVFYIRTLVHELKTQCSY